MAIQSFVTVLFTIVQLTVLSNVAAQLQPGKQRRVRGESKHDRQATIQSTAPPSQGPSQSASLQAPSSIPRTISFDSAPSQSTLLDFLSLPTIAPSLTSQLNATRFYAIGDVPYTDRQATTLRQQVIDLPRDANFLLHVGDIRSARDGRRCRKEEFIAVSDILKESAVPVFLVIGGTCFPSLYARYQNP